MLKPRNQRIRTDYSKQSKSPFPSLPIHPPRRKSTLGYHPESYITKTLNYITHETRYEILTNGEIQTQKKMLSNKLREMNIILNQMLQKEMGRKIQESRIFKKATISKDMGVDFESLYKESNLNNEKIIQLQEELHENNQKLTGLQSLDSKMQFARRFAETEMKVRELKSQLGRIRKNKRLREKQIMQGTVKQNQLIQALQQQYVNISRKNQKIAIKLQQKQQALADVQFQLIQQRDIYQQVKIEWDMINQFEEKLDKPNQQQLIHYNNLIRKREIFTKRNEKQGQMKKKKYYSLLLEYQQLQKKSQYTDKKINNADDKSQQVIRDIAKILEKLRSQNKKTIRTEIERDNDQIFLTRGFAEERIDTQSPKRPYLLQSRKALQIHFNKSNAANRSFIRKWNVEGSIIKQNLPSNPKNEKVYESIDQDDSDEQKGSVLAKIIRQSRQIRHFKTESSPIIDQSNDKNEQEEEIYEQDFQR